MQTLEKRVKIRQTGHVGLKRGAPKFLGRNIARNGAQMDMWVDVGHLNDPLKEFGRTQVGCASVGLVVVLVLCSGLCFSGNLNLYNR